MRSTMKPINLFKFAGCLFVMCVVLTGCETTAPQVDNRPRFYDTASASVILRFNRWDTINMLRPDTREGGFLPIFNRVDIERELKQQRTDRRLAVVVFGFLFPPDIEAQYAQEWDALLSEQGFTRVVILRAGLARDTDGLLVVHDSSIGGGHEQTAVAAAKSAVLPTTARANAANSSSR